LTAPGWSEKPRCPLWSQSKKGSVSDLDLAASN
jgi:hypothetical protein